jgi:GNAT superfamily N-acetyltransferase
LSVEDLELNEVQWWSHWADVQWVGKTSYVMLSSGFEEYFFNRAGFLDCDRGRDTVAELEGKLEGAGRRPHFSVQERCKALVADLESRGYAAFDEMSVMRLGVRPVFRKAARLKVLSGDEVGAVEWTAAYLRSFYGNSLQKKPVAAIVGRLAMERSVTLFAGDEDGKTVGVLATFRTPNLMGVYCVGTLEEHRGKGVAGTLLLEANRVATDEGRQLILQTLLSDGVEGFYSKGGFRRLYLKHMMRRDAPAEVAGEGGDLP